MRAVLALLMMVLASGCVGSNAGAGNDARQLSFDSELGAVQVEVISEGLNSPWALAFLPEGRFLVTERPGKLRIIETDGRIGSPIKGTPVVHAQGQGGLLDVLLDPEFASNQTIYLSYSAPGRNGAHTAVMRAQLLDGQLKHKRVLYRQTPGFDGGHHFGSRLAIGADGFLYVTLGERNQFRDRAQDLDNGIGKVIRIARDGSIPADNPFVGRGNADPAVFTYGHRNPQGAARDPVSGKIWVHEHGPMGGDEINVLVAGGNYGWPVVTYGREYSGASIGEGSSKAGMAPPLYYWVPSIAPSGMAFLTDERAGAWRGNLFVGSLKFQLLVRLEIKDGQVAHEERLLQSMSDRVRDVRAGPDGALYVLTETQGRLLRVRLQSEVRSPDASEG